MLAIYNEDWGHGSWGDSQLILAIWKDGYVVWSDGRLLGGGPYHAGRIEPKRLDSFLSKLDQDGLFAEKGRVSYWGPETKFTAILVQFGKKRVEMQSWHELAESEGGVVAASSGVTPLNGRSLFEALKAEPADYLYFRFLWSEVRARAAGLVPSTGNRVYGRLVKKNNAISWQEMPAGSSPSK